MRDVLVPRSDVSEFRRRYKWLALFVVAAFGVIVVRLFQLEIVHGAEYAARARENIIRRVALPTIRGIIRDGHGRVLASSRPAYNVAVIPGRVMPSARPLRRGQPATDEPDAWPRVADVLRLTPVERARVEARIAAACASDEDRSPCFRSILVREDVPRDIVAELKQHQAELQGAEVIPTSIRYYPYKNLGAHMLGYVAEVDAEAFARFKPPGYEQMNAQERQQLNPLGYEASDTLGATGIERAWESYLRGQRGWERRVVDARGRYRTGPEAERLLDAPVRQDSLPGRDLRLTFDVELEQAVERAMRPHAAGAVVVTEVHTGRLLALYSKPDFDPNELSGGSGRVRAREVLGKLYGDPFRPLLDKTISGTFQPGSTFKPFSALAALKDHIMTAEQREQCEGSIHFGRRVWRCTHAHGPVRMTDALAASCNIYFFRLAEAVGLDRIAKVASAFGLGARTGVGVNPEAPGRIPTRSFYALRYRGQFRLGFTLNAAIGQGSTTVTPLQLALAYGALANGTTLYSPQIVRAVETSDGTVVQEFSPRVRQPLDIERENIARVVEGLYRVVNDPIGTAYPVRDATLDVAGKTGTAQTSYVAKPSDDPKMHWYYARDHAWFAGFAPSKAPEVAIVVLIEHGGAGPTQAAPVALQILHDYGRLAATRAGHAAAVKAASPQAGSAP